jgi:hypothetical protein
MQPINDLDPYLQKQVEAGSSGLDIMHGHLKVLLLEAEEQLEVAEDRLYWEGQVEALAYLYGLTYQLSFAIADREGS